MERLYISTLKTNMAMENTGFEFKLQKIDET